MWDETPISAKSWRIYNICLILSSVGLYHVTCLQRLFYFDWMKHIGSLLIMETLRRMLSVYT